MKKLITAMLLSSLLLTGCATNTVSQDKYSGFLSDYSLLKPKSGEKDRLIYITPDINWTQYNSLMVDRVVIITPDGQYDNDEKLLVAIADNLKELIQQKVAKEMPVVDQPGQGTVRLQAAITSVFTSYDDMKGYQYIPIAAAVTGAKRASGSEKQSVRVMAEARIIDSVDGQLLAQMVDLKTGGEKQDKDSDILLADVAPILELWAERVKDLLVGLKARVK